MGPIRQLLPGQTACVTGTNGVTNAVQKKAEWRAASIADGKEMIQLGDLERFADGR